GGPEAGGARGAAVSGRPGGEPQPQLGCAVEHRGRERPERAGVEHRDSGIEMDLRPGGGPVGGWAHGWRSRALPWVYGMVSATVIGYILRCPEGRGYPSNRAELPRRGGPAAKDRMAGRTLKKLPYPPSPENVPEELTEYPATYRSQQNLLLAGLFIFLLFYLG